MGTKEAPRPPPEALDFDRLVDALVPLLQVTRQALIDAFDRSQSNQKYSGVQVGGQGRYFRSKKWFLNSAKDEQGGVTITHKRGSRYHQYRVGTTTVREYDSEADQIVDAVVPIISGRQSR